MEEIYKILDKIMDLQHRIVNSIVQMAEAEIKKESIKKIEEGLLKQEFEALKKLYDELREAVGEYKDARTKAYLEIMEQQTNIQAPQISARKDDTNIIDAREEMLSYIREAYSDMGYISDLDSDIISIYDGLPEEQLRVTEFEAYNQNIRVLEHKDLFEGIRVGDRLPFWARASIIEECVNSDSYRKAFVGMTRVVESFDENERYDKLLPEEKAALRKSMIYKKYEELFLMMNQEYNGLFSPEVEISTAVQHARKTGGVPVLLGITEREFKLNYTPKVDEYIGNIKDEMREELDIVTSSRRVKKVKPKKVSLKEIKNRKKSKAEEQR